MLSIYEDLVNDKILDINIDDDLDKVIQDYLNKDIKYLYKEYDKIISQDTISSIAELELLKRNTRIEELDKTLFMKSLKIKAIKHLLRDEETKNKDLSNKIKKYKNNSLRYYPRINEYKNYDIFLQELSKKKEFAIHYIPKKRKNSCITTIFELSPHQLFLKNYLSPNTPYNSILIFHGVGVGKTCSGVSIAENFKDLMNKAIILAPEKIQGGWKKNIFDPLKEDNQCTQDEYIFDEDIYEKNKEKMSKQRIKENYEMYGYLSFANSVKKYLDENTRMISSKDLIAKKQKEIELIKKKYSDRVLIIDEVHKIRSDDSLIKERDTILYIEKVIKYSDNLKLILLTANPMFNQPDEIVWILNMLLLNDKRDIIKGKIDFEGNILNEESEKLIREYSKGYISYLRGENPITFPYRIDISQIKGEDKKIMKPKNKDIFGKENKRKKMKFMELYSSPLRGEQFKKYVKEIQKIKGKENISDVTYYGKMLQITNCIYPVTSDDVDDCYGSNGLRNCFTIKNKKPVKYTLKKGITNFLDLDNLGNYSTKIKTIIEKINNSDGITFIYSNFLDGGIMPLVLALEQNGFIKYDKEEILISDKKRKPISYKGTLLEEGESRATYSVIAGGSLKLTNDFENELNILNSLENNNGELIKVVIGSSVAAEGLDFKNIRNIHLLEPWHNINKLEQVIGRGIRNCSHGMLEDPSLRNVTVYLHSSELKDSETIETYMYHECEDKATQIGCIERILKECSIDKYLFQYSNIIKETDIDKIVIKPSLRGNNSFSERPFDKDFSRTCSFLEKCDYIDKNFTIDDKIRGNKLEGSTFTIHYSQPIIDTYKKYIAIIISDFFCLTYEEIVDKMKDNFENYIDDIFNHALDQMIQDRYTLIRNKIKGYIKFTDNYYLFQAIDNEDIFLPSYYRINNGKRDKSDYRLSMDNFSLIDIPEIQEYSASEIEILYNKIKEKSKDFKDYNKIIKIENKNNEELFNSKTIYSFIVDRLPFKDRCKLLYSLLEYILEEKKAKGEEEKFVEILIDLMGTLFIYNNDETGSYEWHPTYNKKNKSKLLGGFIYYYERKEPVMFRYNSEKLILCNNVIKENISEDFKNITQKEIYPETTGKKIGTMFGTLEHNSNVGDGFPYNNIVLKHKRKEDSGKGKIVLQGGWAELQPERLINYIKSEFANEIELRDTTSKLPTSKLTTELEGKNKKITCFALELLLRQNNNFIGGDLLWLYYRIKK